MGVILGSMKLIGASRRPPKGPGGLRNGGLQSTLRQYRGNLLVCPRGSKDDQRLFWGPASVARAWELGEGPRAFGWCASLFVGFIQVERRAPVVVPGLRLSRLQNWAVRVVWGRYRVPAWVNPNNHGGLRGWQYTPNTRTTDFRNSVSSLKCPSDSSPCSIPALSPELTVKRDFSG